MPAHTTKKTAGKTGTSRSYQIAKPDPDKQDEIARMAAEQEISIPQHIWHYYQLGLESATLEEELKKAEAEQAMDREIQYLMFKMTTRQLELIRLMLREADIPDDVVGEAIASADAAVAMKFGSGQPQPAAEE